MNKLAFALVTIATLSLSTTVFAQTSTTASPQRVQSAQSLTHATHHVKKRHGVNKVAVRHDRGLHRGFSHSRHYGYGKNKKVSSNTRLLLKQ
jgi:curli biogenesis system outer membrane secretion channel CsgG